jgi:long-chain acyl-CoA synthetase
LSHTFERTTGYYYPLLQGASIYYAENVNTVTRDLLLARPTAMVSVPRLYEKIYDKIILNLSPFRKIMFDWALKLGIEYRIEQKSKSFFMKFQFWLASILVFSKIKKRTGGRLKFWVSGGAPLRKDLSVFFRALGLPIIEGYGLTETSPVLTCNRLDNMKTGSVGLPLARVQVKCSEEGELLVKGPNVMQGYWKKPEQTKEVLDEQGWFHTGDIASIDEQGFVFIVDRKKELIVLSNGKKVAPQYIESLLMASPFISQAIVIGDQRHYLTALLFPNYPALSKLTRFMDIKDMLVKEMESRLSHLARYEQVKKILLLEEELTAEKGFLTPSLKYKRKLIYTHYQEAIEALYQEGEQ